MTEAQQKNHKIELKHFKIFLFVFFFACLLVCNSVAGLWVMMSLRKHRRLDVPSRTVHEVGATTDLEELAMCTQAWRKNFPQRL